jgi:hypothetical protein
MASGFVLGGVCLSPIVWACLAALLATAGLSALLARIGFYRLVWRRPLVEVALFCMLLAAASWAPVIGVAP